MLTGVHPVILLSMCVISGRRARARMDATGTGSSPSTSMRSAHTHCRTGGFLPTTALRLQVYSLFRTLCCQFSQKNLFYFVRQQQQQTFFLFRYISFLKKKIKIFLTQNTCSCNGLFVTVFF